MRSFCDDVLCKGSAAENPCFPAEPQVDGGVAGGDFGADSVVPIRDATVLRVLAVVGRGQFPVLFELDNVFAEFISQFEHGLLRLWRDRRGPMADRAKSALIEIMARRTHCFRVVSESNAAFAHGFHAQTARNQETCQ